MAQTDSLLIETVRTIAMAESTPPTGCVKPTHVDVRLTVPLTLDDVQALNEWLQEPKPVDVSHVVIDRAGVTVASHREWEAHRGVTAPRSRDLSRDLDTAVAMLRATLDRHS
ncbi:MAG TPA: hypothetical protein VLD86_04085 [Ilumatobacteraceae bacterium]|nr:hypothetical protein [Ilumatobacteraceae bacterium]